MVNISFKYILVLITTILISCSEPEPETEKEIIGHVDGLVITKEGEFRFQFSLNGRPVHTLTTADRLWLKKYFGKLGDDRVVLLEEYAGGNICQSFSNRLFSWRADGAYTITDRFGHCGGEPVEQIGDKLILRYKSYKAEHTDLVYPVQVWEYRNSGIKQIK